MQRRLWFQIAKKVSTTTRNLDVSPLLMNVTLMMLFADLKLSNNSTGTSQYFLIVYDLNKNISGCIIYYET